MEVQVILDGVIKYCETSLEDRCFEDAFSLLIDLKEDHKFEAIAYSRYVFELAMNKVVQCGAEHIDIAKKLLRTIEDILKMNAPDDFDSYMLFMEWKREPQHRFWMPRRNILKPVAEGFQDIADNRLDILIVSLPPRVGKSTTGVFFTTWQMGRYPRHANVMSGHSDKLTKGFHEEALSIVSDHETYQFHEVFPKAPMVEKSMADETINLQIKSRFPSLTCRAIGGTLTGAVEVGKRGVLYCDDLVSDREEALSQDRMDKLYAAYLNQLKDRMKDGAKIVHVGTRWVPDDVIGRVTEENKNNPRCRVINIPALDENGESNFQYLYGVGFTTEYYEEMRNDLVNAGEEDSWSAKYMADPYYIGGRTFDKEELRFYDGTLPEGEPDGIIAVCDTKDRGSDYACSPVGYIYGNDHYIHDVVCDNSLPEKVEPKIVNLYVKNNVAMSRFESNSAGGRVADDIGKACKERGLDIDIQKKFSTENKETRILVDSFWIKEHCIFRSDEPTPDYKRFLNMLTHYSTEGKNKHDDAPDAMSMYKRFASGMGVAEVEAFERPF